jgi:hypothetical protein
VEATKRVAQETGQQKTVVQFFFFFSIFLFLYLAEQICLITTKKMSHGRADPTSQRHELNSRELRG